VTVQVVRRWLSAFEDGGGRDGLLADGFRMVGEAQGAPVLAFAVPGATRAELRRRGMTITFDDVLEAPDGALVWGEWTRDGDEPEFYCVVLTTQDGQIVEAWFFDDLDHARWAAGL
jgi:hypothetical protein